MYLHGNLVFALESVLIVVIGTSVQELTGDMHDRLAVAFDGTADFDHLTRILVDDGVDLRSSVKDIWTSLRRSPSILRGKMGLVMAFHPTTIAKSIGAYVS